MCKAQGNCPSPCCIWGSPTPQPPPEQPHLVHLLLQRSLLPDSLSQSCWSVSFRHFAQRPLNIVAAAAKVATTLQRCKWLALLQQQAALLSALPPPRRNAAVPAAIRQPARSPPTLC